MMFDTQNSQTIFANHTNMFVSNTLVAISNVNPQICNIKQDCFVRLNLKTIHTHIQANQPGTNYH